MGSGALFCGIVSICNEYHTSVAMSVDEPDLALPEQNHVCDPQMLIRIKRLANIAEHPEST